MTDPDANPTKPRPHGAYRPAQLERRCGQCHALLADGDDVCPKGCCWDVNADGSITPGNLNTPDRAHLDREQHITADEAERFTEELGKRWGLK